ncbi:MAG: TldD/PmbA family protein, partial [Candidatus Kariarchaeaceae archaeon]
RVVIRIVDGNIEEASSGVMDGTGVRVLHNGAWGFAATTSPSANAIARSAEEAGVMAKKGSTYLSKPIILSEIPICEEEFHSPFQIDLRSIPIEEKIQKFAEASAWIQKADKLASFTLYYDDQIEEVSFLNSEGSSFIRSFQKPTSVANVILADQGKIRPAIHSYSNTCGAEFLTKHDPLNMVKEVYQEGLRLLSAKVVKGGQQDCILSHGVVGLLAHEAIGHTAESDLVKTGSFLKGKRGEKIASELVTLIDSPVVGDAAGWIPIDDEEVIGKSVEIIKDGILQDYLVNRDDAYRFQTEVTGNARAFSHRDIPIVRMRNTYIDKGDMNEEEIYEVIKNGYLLKGARGGQADFNGEFMFGCREAIEIKNGELGESYVGASISGNSFEVLKGVKGVGKKLVMDLGAGSCGKGQPAKVDAGGPLIACTVFVGGEH